MNELGYLYIHWCLAQLTLDCMSQDKAFAHDAIYRFVFVTLSSSSSINNG